MGQNYKMSGARYEFQKKKTGFVVCFYRNKMSTVHDAYDMLEDGDKKPINPEKADKKSSGLFEK
ncbi:hypothetical protein [Enterococcus cecorum]|uniref:hypothetical protein n=1 Tax=Enterococcus cecorum TaxID=44008 RepID=UPI00200B1E6C|nr:hypothetical protein [Enterococcus cecorum]